MEMLGYASQAHPLNCGITDTSLKRRRDVAAYAPRRPQRRTSLRPRWRGVKVIALAKARPAPARFSSDRRPRLGIHRQVAPARRSSETVKS